MLDVLIQNGLVIDGSGSPGFFAAVLIKGDAITIQRGDVSHLEATRIIDASGYVVCPGFVDLHSHAGLTIMGEPHHDPKVRQGVTTELIGIDGMSHAPFKTRGEQERYIWQDSGLNGYPPLPTDWLTVAEQLSKYDNAVAVNQAFILGNSPVRIWGVGWNDRPATSSELEDMKSVVREAMEEGAWGLSTGLDYPPGSYASTAELSELAQVAARLGGHYHTHTRASLRTNGLLAPWEEALEIGRNGDCPVPYPLPARCLWGGQSSGLFRTGRKRTQRRYGRDVRLLYLSLLGDHSDNRFSPLGQGRWSREANGRLKGRRRPRAHETRTLARSVRKQLANQF